jgi:hypothetical protein
MPTSERKPERKKQASGNNRPRVNSELLDLAPPDAPEAVLQLLGYVLVNGKMPDAAKHLAAWHFRGKTYDRVWKYISELSIQSVDLTPANLAPLYRRDGLEFPAADIAEIIGAACVTSATAAYNAGLIERAAKQRRLRELGIELIQRAHNGKIDREEIKLLFDDVIETETSESILFPALTCAELDGGQFDIEFLISGILVARQPCIMAGPQKSLKTSLLVDLGISLATGGHFLGRFPVTRPARVALMTGESGLGTLQETARRIAYAAGKHLAEIDGLLFSEHLPRFGNYEHETALEKFIVDNALEVLAIDPAYLAMPGDRPENLFEQGRLLRGMSEVCREAGCMMILAHHTRKGRVDPFAVPELSDIAWSGFQEFARQWLLVGRRELYLPGSGEHRLWLSVGGSAGHGGLWALDIQEGTQATSGGRYWNVEVLSTDDARAAVVDHKATQRQARQTEQLEADRREIVGAAVKLPGPETKNGLRDRVAIPHKRFPAAFASLVADGSLQDVEIQKSNGQKYTGWRLRNDEK